MGGGRGQVDGGEEAGVVVGAVFVGSEGYGGFS